MDDEWLYREIGTIIAARRDKLGLKQAEVATRIGISRASLANMEVGRQRLLVHQLYRLAEALQLDGPQLLLPTKQNGPKISPIPIGSLDLTPKQLNQVENLINSVTATKQRIVGN